MYKALILAGGMGSRLGKLTKDKPKPMMRVNSKPILYHLINGLKIHGIKDIHISIGYKSDKIIDYFGSGYKFGVKITYHKEDKPLGTGGAIKNIASKWKEPFYLLWGDNLANINYIELMKEFTKQKTRLLVTLTHREDVENYGVVKIKKGIKRK